MDLMTTLPAPTSGTSRAKRPAKSFGSEREIMTASPLEVSAIS